MIEPALLPILVAAFRDAEELLAAYDARAGILAVATRAEAAPGTPLIVEIGWPALGSRVPVRARARRRWLGGGLSLRIEREDRPKLEFLARVAGGYLAAPVSRRHLRFCVRVPIRWRVFGGAELHPGHAEDLSSGGALLVTRAGEAAPGDHVAIRLWPEPRGGDLVVTGSIRHAQRRNDGRLVLGVGFEYRESHQQRSLRGVLRGFAGRGVVTSTR